MYCRPRPFVFYHSGILKLPSFRRIDLGSSFMYLIVMHYHSFFVLYAVIKKINSGCRRQLLLLHTFINVASFSSPRPDYFLSDSICKQGPGSRLEMEMEEEAAGSYGRGPRRGKKKRFLKSGRQEFHNPSLPD